MPTLTMIMIFKQIYAIKHFCVRDAVVFDLHPKLKPTRNPAQQPARVSGRVLGLFEFCVFSIVVSDQGLLELKMIVFQSQSKILIFLGRLLVPSCLYS